MTHPGFEAQLDAYLDGELAAVDARELEAHVAQCPECTRFRDGRLALRESVTAHVPAFQAPDALRERVRAALGTAARAGAPHRVGMRGVWRPLALAASLAVVALGSWKLALQHAAGETLADQVLASHIRSLMPVLMWFSSAMKMENLHPLQWGIFRVKHRKDRRPGFPIESALSFYANYAAETSRKATKLARRIRYADRIGRGPMRRCEMVTAPDFFES